MASDRQDPTAGRAIVANAADSTWSVDRSLLVGERCSRCGKEGTTPVEHEHVCPGCLTWEVLSRPRTASADAARAALEGLRLTFATPSAVAPGAESVSAPDGAALVQSLGRETLALRLGGHRANAVLTPAASLPTGVPEPWIVRRRGRPDMVVLRWRVWHLLGPTYEARWDPEAGWRQDVLNVDPDRPDAVAALLDIVRTEAKVGRPLGSTHRTEAELRELVPVLRAQHEREHGKPPTMLWLALRLGVSKKTFERYRGRWPDLFG